MSATRVQIKKEDPSGPRLVTVKVEEPSPIHIQQPSSSGISLQSTTNNQAVTVVKTENPTSTIRNSPQPDQQIFIIQTSDGNVPMEGTEVVVAEDLSVFEAVTALNQLSRENNGNSSSNGLNGNGGLGGPQVITTDGGDVIQVYEEVVLSDGTTTSSALDQFVDVAEVEVGDGGVRSVSPKMVGDFELIQQPKPKKRRKNTPTQQQIMMSGGLAGGGNSVSLSYSPAGSSTSTASGLGLLSSGNNSMMAEEATIAGGEFHICRICNQFVPLGELTMHNAQEHGKLSELTCTDCGKLFKSKRSLFGHKKEKHSGIIEQHTCPECGKTFGRKSNLKAHRESLHYGKKFPCSFCERIFTNRSSMNQHVKKTHIGTLVAMDSFEINT